MLREWACMCLCVYVCVYMYANMYVIYTCFWREIEGTRLSTTETRPPLDHNRSCENGAGYFTKQFAEFHKIIPPTLKRETKSWNLQWYPYATPTISISNQSYCLKPAYPHLTCPWKKTECFGVRDPCCFSPAEKCAGKFLARRHDIVGCAGNFFPRWDLCGDVCQKTCRKDPNTKRI